MIEINVATTQKHITSNVAQIQNGWNPKHVCFEAQIRALRKDGIDASTVQITFSVDLQMDGAAFIDVVRGVADVTFLQCLHPLKVFLVYAIEALFTNILEWQFHPL